MLLHLGRAGFHTQIDHCRLLSGLSVVAVASVVLNEFTQVDVCRRHLWDLGVHVVVVMVACLVPPGCLLFPKDEAPAGHSSKKEQKAPKKDPCDGTVCGKDVCICPDCIRGLAKREEAQYIRHDDKKETFLRVSCNDMGEKFLGCILCQTYLGKDGVAASTGKARMAIGEMKITDSISMDTVKSHIGKDAKKRTERLSDHCRAVDAYNKEAPEKADDAAVPGDGGAGAAEVASADAPSSSSSMRKTAQPSTQLLNTTLACYLVSKKPLAGTVYSLIMSLLHEVGGNVTKRYSGYWFYKEMLISMNVILWERAIRFVKAQRSIALYWDIGAGYLLIRVGGFDNNLHMETMFWQGRELANKTAAGIYRSIMQAFTTKPLEELDDDPALALTEQEFFEKLKVLR